MVNIENWLPMTPLQGPPLPRFLDIYWPWIHPELPPGETPPGGEVPPGGQVKFAYSEQKCWIRGPFPEATAWKQPGYSVKITNQSEVAGSRTITLHYSDKWLDNPNDPGHSLQKSWVQNLEAGQSVVIDDCDIWPSSDDFWIGHGCGIPMALGHPCGVWIHVEDDAGGGTNDCYTETS